MKWPFPPILLLLAVLSACQDPMPEVSHGRIVRHADFPSQYLPSRHIDVWLPPDFDESIRHPVMYMHDGQMLFDASHTWNGQEWGVDEVVGEMILSGELPPLIVVGIWNRPQDRHREYFPQKPWESLPKAFRDSLKNSESYEGLFNGPIRSDAYLKFIVEEVKPFIDEQYPTNPRRSYTFIGGSSMGGLISMYAVCEYPYVFKGAACMSTHWPGIFEAKGNPVPEAFARYMSEHLGEPDRYRWYFDYGTGTLDSLYEPYQQRIDTVMAQAGFGAPNWQTHRFEGADHSERSWNARLDKPFLALFPPEDTFFTRVP